MKNRKTVALALTAFAFILGLLLPLLASLAEDRALSRRFWPLDDESNSHYAYQSTFINRVVALNASLNQSPSVERSPNVAAIVPTELIDVLSSILPVSSPLKESASSFTLSPKQYFAEYKYLVLDYTLDSARLSVITDTETGIPLRLELTCSPDVLQAWLMHRDLWNVLHDYADHFHLGELADGESTVSSLLRSQSAPLRGSALEAVVTVMPASGFLLLRLIPSSTV